MALVKRIANLTDVDFISSCLLHGARKGHYAFNADNPQSVSWMKQEIKSVISHGKLLDLRSAQATVYTDQSRRIGTIILCKAEISAPGYEIYAMSVAGKYQNQGYGKRLLDETLSHLAHTTVSARCTVASDKMKKLLQSRGFRFQCLDGEYEILLKDAPDSSDLLKPMVMRY